MFDNNQYLHILTAIVTFAERNSDVVSQPQRDFAILFFVSAYFVQHLITHSVRASETVLASTDTS